MEGLDRLFFQPKAVRQVKKFIAPENKALKRALMAIIESPQKGGFLKGSLRKIRKWKFNIGKTPYRIAYQLESSRITIVAVGKRKDFYEILGR